MKLNELTLKQATVLLKKKEISLSDFYSDIANVIYQKNKELNVYLSLDNNAVDKAKKLTQLPLAGVPIAVKDNFLTVGLPTTASSKVLRGFMPSYDSAVTKKIKDAGGVVIGKTNMDAWAHGSSTETSDFGPTKNPRNPAYLPGGSSGGSAAAVAANLCTTAIGSETAGSIRQPASWCGVVGLKPTYGRVSRYGVVAMGSSLDCPGPITKTVEDAAMLLNFIAGKDSCDATTSDQKVPDFTKALNFSIKGMKIGVCYIDHPLIKNTDAAKATYEAVKIFEKLDAKVKHIPIASTLVDGKILNHEYAIAAYTVIQRSEVSSNLARYDGIRYGYDRTNFQKEAKRRIILGTYTLSKGYADKYYVKAQKVRSLFIKNYSQLFSEFDILISPTSPGYALELGASANNPMFGELMDMLVEASAISGLPGVNVPMWHDAKTNLYLGLNIIADKWQEEKIIAAAQAFELHTPWNSWRKNNS